MSNFKKIIYTLSLWFPELFDLYLLSKMNLKTGHALISSLTNPHLNSSSSSSNKNKAKKNNQ